MPKVQKVLLLDVNPTTYLRACSTEELVELQLALDSPVYAKRINKALNPNTKKFA